jgi:hypothetical protein
MQSVKDIWRQKTMRILFVIAGCLALAFTAGGAQNKHDEENPPPKKGAVKSAQVSQRGGVPAGRAVGSARSAEVSQRGGVPAGRAVGPAGAHYKQGTYTASGVGRRQFQDTTAKTSTAPFRRGTATSAVSTTQRSATTGRNFQTRRFDLQTQTRSITAPRVTYRAGSRIEGSRTWQGSNYSAFRDYNSQWHDRTWWRRHHDRIVFVFGSPYYWNSGYWYPAWGYDPYASYYYDGPIYAYNDLPPDQVIANVQAALQEQGYYTGEVDGVLGPLTRAAIARYQQDHGLYVTSAIDEPTLSALGMS